MSDDGADRARDRDSEDGDGRPPGELGPDSGVWFIDQLLRAQDEASPSPPAPDDGAEPVPQDARVRDDVPVLRRVRHRRRGSLERRLVVALVVLLVACVGLGAGVVIRVRHDAAVAAGDASRFSDVAAGSPVVAVVGDETVLQASSTVAAAQLWTSLLGDDLDGRVVRLASPRMGYVATGVSGSTFVQEAARVPSDAAVVLFVGGGADERTASLPLVTAATKAFSAAAQHAPKARVIAIGPLFTAAGSTAPTTQLRRSLRIAAATSEITWADPIGGDWLGSAGETSFATSDLSVSDEQTIAERVVALIRSTQQ